MKRIIILLVVLAIIGVISYVALKYQSNTDGVGMACTEEALICPDGSGVGRSGPECKFDSCANNGPYKGVLKQQESGFVLVMNSPDLGGEYNLPLEVRVSNAVSSFIDKSVSIIGDFKEGNTLAVETISESGIETHNVAEIGVGETKTINDLFITLNEFVQDSRCPVDANCIEAGGVTVNITLESGSKSETKNMASDEVPLVFEDYSVSIVNVAPPRMSGEDPAANEYRVMFKVEKN